MGAKTAKTTKPGIVQKVIQSPIPEEPDKAEIAIQGADELTAKSASIMSSKTIPATR